MAPSSHDAKAQGDGVASNTGWAGAWGVVVRAVGRGDVIYTDFTSTAGLTRNGDTAAVTSTFVNGTTFDGNVLRVAPVILDPSNSISAGSHGSAFLSSPLNVTSGFNTFFTFRINSTDNVGFGGADGFTFTIQQTAPTALGDGGGFIGYGGAPGITPSYAVVFDTFKNDATEPSSNYIGLVSNGTLNDGVTPHLANTDLTGNASVSLKDQHLVYTWIDYVGGQLNVYASENGTKPGAALLSQAVNLLSFSSAYLGFTAATGGGYANYDILNWNLNTTGSAYGNAASAPFTDIHAVGTNGLLWSVAGTWVENTTPSIVHNVFLGDGSAGQYAVTVDSSTRPRHNPCTCKAPTAMKRNC